MSVFKALGQFKESVTLYWLGRTEQERKFLGAGGAVVVLALVYSVAIDPALTGKANLQRDLPKLRLQAAELQALALEAGDLARQPPVQPAPMTKEALSASLLARSLTPASLSVTGEYAKLQFTGVSFANLEGWLETQRRENRAAVLEATFTGQTPAGNVDATLTLHQDRGTGQ
jgi:general secretion pathway protein M